MLFRAGSNEQKGKITVSGGNLRITWKKNQINNQGTSKLIIPVKKQLYGVPKFSVEL